jgi:hypothetical protein
MKIEEEDEKEDEDDFQVRRRAAPRDATNDENGKGLGLGLGLGLGGEVSIFWSDAMPRPVAPQPMRIEEEDENDDEGGLHVSLPILLILLILSAFSGQFSRMARWMRIGGVRRWPSAAAA